MKLQKRNAIVTGGSLGLGAAIVKEFIQEGANVLFCSRNKKDAKQLLLSLKKKVLPEQRLVYQQCDMANPKDVDQFFKKALSEFKTIHILVNNAGIYGPIGPSEEISWKDWVQTIQINLYGLFAACQKAIPIFKKNAYGKIINLSGGGATNPLPRFSAYAASKAAVVRLTETLAEELRGTGIDVNTISPGALNTRLLKQVLDSGPNKTGESFFQKALKQTSEGGVPLERGAKLCVYLASETSDGISGKLISAQWDPWEKLHEFKEELRSSDIYTLRRIIPQDRGKKW